ncbi:DUF5362 family protein [Polaribacter sp.]|uniref:DUF5362 family protein n=1 Tax=Polaribacter sp. TaxID=1920175 RepID=UPI003EF1C8FF
MENPITQLEQLTLTNASKSFLRETAKWAKFLSIIGFIGIGLLLIGSFFIGSLYENLPQTAGLPFNLGIFMTIFYIIIALIYFFPVYYLFQFSKKMKMALLTKNDDTLADAFEVLKSHYKFLGVFTIIIISIYLLIFIVGILGFAFS